MQKAIFYILALIAGGLLAFYVIFQWETIYNQVYEVRIPSSTLNTDSEFSEEHDHSKRENDHSEHEHEEDLIILSKEQMDDMKLETRTAGPGILSLALSTTGKIILHPDHLAHIIPKISGVAITANKNIGDLVKLNEIMAILESQSMADIKAAYLGALSKQRLSISSLQREELLFKEKITSEQDFLNAKNIFEESAINVQLTRQKLLAFGLSNDEINDLESQKLPELSLYPIRSPINGVVIMRHITKGEFIENTTPIYEVANLTTVWVEIGIYPKELSRVEEGQMVEVVNPLDQTTSQARLIFVSPLVKDETITAKAVAELKNEKGLWRPGVFVKVNISTGKMSKSLVIPREAIQSSEEKDFIFIVTPNGIERRFITIGMSDDKNSEVLSGLQQGEEYIFNKTFLLKAELGKEGVEHEH